jgi:hypothetical protein
MSGIQAQSSPPASVVRPAPKPTPAPTTAAPAAATDAFQPSKGYTTLQKHVAYFDTNGDGKVTLAETRQGLEDLGLAKPLAYPAALAINGLLGSQTSGHRTFDVSVANIKAGKHPSDTGAIDAEGTFHPEVLDRIFQKYDHDHSGALSQSELDALVADDKVDVKGNLGAKGEFGLLLKLAADRTKVVNGKTEPAISRERLQSFYDGTLFYQLAAKNGHPHPRRD